MAGAAVRECQALAVVLAVSLLSGSSEDPSGEEMLAIARAAVEGC
jgi:hypothetical protein